MVSLGYNEKEEKLIAIAMRGKMLKCSTKEDTILKETISESKRFTFFIFVFL